MSFFKFDSKNKGVETATAADFSYSDGYGQFAEGSTYSFTDKDKFTNYMNASNTDTSTSDMTTVTVTKTSTNHGTQENPYVIDSYAMWKKFAQASDSTYFYGKVFALAVDITFTASTSSQPFIPRDTFAGTFYGLGHTFKNITASPTSSTNKGFGVFCKTAWSDANYSNASSKNPTVITDLNVENYQFSSVPYYTGAIVGWVCNRVYILNCHANGTVSRTTAVDSDIAYGGIVGGAETYETPPANNNSATLAASKWYLYSITCYRCSSDCTANITCNTGRGAYIGGLCGAVWRASSGYFYECYADMSVTLSGCSIASVSGILGIFPATAYNNVGGALVIQDCVGMATLMFGGWGSGGSNTPACGSLFGVLGDNASGSPWSQSKCSITAKNTYTSTYLLGSAGGKYYFAPWMYPTSTTLNFNTPTTSNIYYSRGNSTAASHDSAENRITAVKPAGSKYEASESTLWTNAQATTSPLKSKIWTNKGKIGAAAYSIADSPLKNKEIGKPLSISFYNLKKDGSVVTEESIRTAETFVYNTSLTKQLTTATTTYTDRTFKGWSRNSEGTDIVADDRLDLSGFYGHIKLYAVWELKGITSSISQSGGTLNSTTNTYEAESGTRISVNATVNVPTTAVAASNVEVVYSWKKDGVADAGLGSEYTTTVSTADKSGEYTYSYVVKDKTMPLATYSGSCGSTIKIEITGKSTTKQDFRIKTDTPSYIGRNLGDVQFTLVMVDDGKTVAGTAAWETPPLAIHEGTNTTNVVFTPSDNIYKTMTVEVEFEAVPFPLTFRFTDLVIDDLVADIDYNQAYAATDIVNFFLDAYNAKIAESSNFEAAVANYTPMLNGVKITEYNTPFPKATTAQTINVTLAPPEEYEVTFIYDYDDMVETKNVNWNGKLATPTAPNRGKDWTLEGWYVTDEYGTWNEDDRWDFTTDRVTSDLTLTANWIEDILTLQSLTVTPRKSQYTALTTLTNDDFLVTANYTRSSGGTYSRKLSMDDGSGEGYEVFVDGIKDGILYVSTTGVEIRFESLSKEVAITVKPISLDAHLKDFKYELPVIDANVDGSPVEIDEFILSIEDLPMPLPDIVTNIVPTYKKGSTNIGADEITAKGTYTLILTFDLDENYSLSPISRTFQVVAPREEVTVEWADEDEFIYNEKKQHPTATVHKNSGTLTAAQFYYVILNDEGEEVEGIDAGTYTVRVALPTSVQNQYKFAVGTPLEMSFTIQPKTIARPTFGTVKPLTYNGEEQDVSSKILGFDSAKMVIGGEFSAKDANRDGESYTASITPSKNYTWENASTPVGVEWTIAKAKLTVVWDNSKTTFRVSDTERYPKVKSITGLKEGDAFDVETDVIYDGVDESEIGGYIAKVVGFNTDWANNYEIQDIGKGYRIISDTASLDDPNNPTIPDPANPNGSNSNQNGGGNENGATGDGPSGEFISAIIPIILSGVSLLLIVVFAIMTLNFNSAAKAAREKTKKLAAISYSFAPCGLLALTLGLSVTNWWIVAGVLMGLALIMAIVAFLFHGKKKKALAMLEEEQERVAEEKELARLEKEEQEKREMREEQARRDNEMKMMFAAMQQGGGYAQAQPMYDDAHIQNLIASTVSALLPAMQQQMALPPAQDSSAYTAPQPDYAARAENEQLRAQLAQQQELLNQILQNQQQAQQQAYEEEPVDDISWLGESEEVVSLEESYGALSDEGKRAYYEIGSYIMCKPRTSQNDGRYAVLFKYRGKTVFKLAIKDDAPVLYYPTGSSRGEIRVEDASALELAKSMIDSTVSNVDSQA